MIASDNCYNSEIYIKESIQKGFGSTLFFIRQNHGQACIVITAPIGAICDSTTALHCIIAIKYYLKKSSPTLMKDSIVHCTHCLNS